MMKESSRLLNDTSLTILFDLDGVLISTPGMHDKALNAALQELGYPEMKHSGEEAITSVEKLRRLGITAEHDVLRVKDVKNRLFVNDLDNMIYDPLLVDQLCLLSTVHRLALCTNSTKSSAMAMLRHAGIHRSFDVILAQEDVDNPKPAPDLYNWAMRLLDADPERTIIFEDSLPGFTAACASDAMFPVRTDYNSMKTWLNTMTKRIGSMK